MTESVLHANHQHESLSCDIVIVGGGMVGVTLALMLAKAQKQSRSKTNDQPWSITLVEHFPLAVQHKQATSEQSKQQQPSFDARSTALSAGSIELLKPLGCWSAIQAQAEPIKNIHISDQGHYSGTLLQSEEYAVDALGYVVENHFLGQCLLDELTQSSVHCLAPATVASCQLKQQGASLTVVQETKTTIVDARLVFVADGAESSLRQSLGIDTEIHSYQQSAIIANVALAKPHQGVAYERFTDQGPLALLPLSDCEIACEHHSPQMKSAYRASLVWTRNHDQVDTLMQMNEEQFLRELQLCFGYRADKILYVGERHAYPLQLIQATEQIRSHIAVVGNAAHFLHPVAGQGFNLSIRDCAAAVDVLLEADESTEPLGCYRMLERYQQRRATDQQLTIGLTDTLVKLFSSADLSKTMLRQLGLFGLTALPSAKKQLARQMMGMG